MNTLYQKVRRYTFHAHTCIMYICIYFTCTHNLFKLQPLLDRFQMQTAGCCISNLATHYEISGGTDNSLIRDRTETNPESGNKTSRLLSPLVIFTCTNAWKKSQLR